MIDHEAFRSRLDACLDERRDPLDDPEVVAWLDQHPEQLDAFAQQREDLRQLSSRPGPARARRWRRAAAVGGLAGAAAAVVAWTLLTPPAPPPRRPRILSAELVEIAPRLDASVTVTLRAPLLETESTVLESWQRRSRPR